MYAALNIILNAEFNSSLSNVLQSMHVLRAPCRFVFDLEQSYFLYMHHIHTATKVIA